MKTSLLSLVGIALVLAGVIQDDADKSPKDETETRMLVPVVSFSGNDSEISERSFHRIQTLDEFAVVWRKHTGQTKVEWKGWNGKYDTFYNTLGIPMVNFDHYMVIAIFDGAGVNCAGLDVVTITNAKDQIRFRFEDKPYGTEGGHDDVKSFGIFVVPKSNKSIVIEKKVPAAKDIVTGLRAGDTKPTWKKCHEFDALNQNAKEKAKENGSPKSDQK